MARLLAELNEDVMRERMERDLCPNCEVDFKARGEGFCAKCLEREAPGQIADDERPQTEHEAYGLAHA